MSEAEHPVVKEIMDTFIVRGHPNNRRVALVALKHVQAWREMRNAELEYSQNAYEMGPVGGMRLERARDTLRELGYTP